MAFVRRDSEGVIVAAAAERSPECGEELPADDPELRRFLDDLNGGVGAPLGATDQDFIRVLEDLVELLTAKGVILFTELPEFAQRKILNRQRLRSEMSQSLDLLDED